jgi:hypothetical protein
MIRTRNASTHSSAETTLHRNHHAPQIAPIAVIGFQ